MQRSLARRVTVSMDTSKRLFVAVMLLLGCFTLLWFVHSRPAPVSAPLSAAAHVRIAPKNPVKIAQAKKRTSMANPQLVIGGAAVNLPQSGGSFYNPAGSGNFQLYSPQGSGPPPTLGSATPVPAAGASVTVGGITVKNTGSSVSYGGQTFPVLSLAAVSAPAAANYNLVQSVGPSSSGAAFDIVTTGATSLPAQTVTETAVTNSVSRGAASRSARTAALAAFSVLATSGSVSPATPPVTLAPRTAVNFVISEQSVSRGPLRRASRQSVNPAFAEFVPSTAAALPAQTLTETMFSVQSLRGPMTYASRTLMEGFVFGSAARGGRVAPAGTTAPPILALEAPAFAASGSRGAAALAPRTVILPVFTNSAFAGVRAQALRTAQNTVFSQAAASGLVSSAPLPQNTDSRDPFVVLLQELRFLLAAAQGNPMTTTQTNLAFLDKLAASYRINEL